MGKKFDDYLKEKIDAGELYYLNQEQLKTYQSTEIPKWDDKKVINNTSNGDLMGQFSIPHLLILALICWWVYSLVHLLKSKRPDKVLWTIVMMGLSFLGVILYWTIGKQKEIQ